MHKNPQALKFLRVCGGLSRTKEDMKIMRHRNETQNKGTEYTDDVAISENCMENTVTENSDTESSHRVGLGDQEIEISD